MRGACQYSAALPIVAAGIVAHVQYRSGHGRAKQIARFAAQ